MIDHAGNLSGWVILGSVFLILLQVGLSVVVGLNAFALRRLIWQNDRDHATTEVAIATLCKALGDEREARHTDFRVLTSEVSKSVERTHQLDQRVTADYATEERVMTQHGMVVQALYVLSGKLERLIGASADRQARPEKPEE